MKLFNFNQRYELVYHYPSNPFRAIFLGGWSVAYHNFNWLRCINNDCPIDDRPLKYIGAEPLPLNRINDIIELLKRER